MDKGRKADAGTILEKMKESVIKEAVKETVKELVEQGYLRIDSNGHLEKINLQPEIIILQKDLKLN